MLMGEHKRAREYLSKTVAIQDNYQGARSLNGWIELTCGSEVKAKKANDMFKEAQEKYPNDIDAYIGQATFLEQVKKDVKGAINVLTTCAVKFSWFTPSESERARLLLAMKEWDLAAESANKALQLDPNNIQALSLTITILLARDSKYSTASSRLAELADIIHETEPHNAQLCHDTAALFARLCARQGTLLALPPCLSSHAVSVARGTRDRWCVPTGATRLTTRQTPWRPLQRQSLEAATASKSMWPGPATGFSSKQHV